MQDSKPIYIVLAIVIAIPLVFVVLFVSGLFYGNLQTRGHQGFARRSVALIAPAAEMDSLFVGCRHYITYGGTGSPPVPLFNSTAYFGGRYELVMQVPVVITSETSGGVAGPARFYLHEVGEVSVSPEGQVSVRFSGGLEFGEVEWAKLVAAQGDFSVIGFEIDPTPVAGFDAYESASRPSN